MFRMSEIDNINKQLYIENEYKQFMRSMKKIRKDNQDELTFEKRNAQSRVKSIKDEYIKGEESLKNQLQEKLVKLRNSHGKIITQEKSRLSRELILIQKSHQEKMAELNQTNNNQINQKGEELQDKLDNFEMKYQREKSKYGA